MKLIKIIKSLSIILFTLSLQTGMAQLSVKDSITWLIDSTAKESAERQYVYKKRALSLAKQNNLKEEEAKILIKLGIIIAHLGDYAQALDYYAKAKLIIDEYHFTALKTKFYLEKTGIFRQLEQNKEGIRHNEEAITWFEKQKDSISLGLAYNNLGGMYYRAKEIEQAQASFEKALLILENTPRKNDAMVLSNLGAIYAEKREPIKAIPLFETYLKENRKTKDNIFHEAGMLLNIGSMYGFLKNRTKAFAYYDTASILIEKEKFPDLQYIILQAKSETYEELGDYPKALQFYKKYKEIQEETIGKKTQEQILEWKVKYETAHKEKELAVEKEKVLHLEQEASFKNQQYLFLLLLGLIGGGLGIFMYKKRITDLKKEKELQGIQQHLMESELKNKQLEQQRLEEQLAYQYKDLTNLTLDITRKNEFSNQLLAQIEDLKKYVPTSGKKQLNNIKLFATNHLQINKELEVFQKNIDTVNQNFYRKLLERFPILTPKDTELCGLIKLNRTNKEIATIKNISVSSAKMGRYRLRKKLGLESSENIVHFLRDFS